MNQIRFELQYPPHNGLNARQTAKTVIEDFEGELTPQNLAAMQARLEATGAKVVTWAVGQKLPFDEGYQASAKPGASLADNPYAERFWKHQEWKLGFQSRAAAA